MRVVVGEHVAHALVDHGEEGAEGSQAGEVHDVLQLLPELQAADHQPVRREVRSKKVGRIALHLKEK